MGMGEDANGKGFQEFRYEIAPNQGFECTVNGVSCQNDVEFQMFTDTVITLRLIAEQNQN
jgi:hypothetical protein